MRYKRDVSPEQLEKSLIDLPNVGTLVKDRGYRQIWRLEIDGQGYYLKFFTRTGRGIKRIARGNPALREFAGLQTLQKAKISSPRAVAMLAGFVLKGEKGDAVLSKEIEGGQTLDVYYNQHSLKGTLPADHFQIVRKLIALLKQVGEAKLGHNDLHLGNILLKDGELYLLDAYAVRPGGLKTEQVLRMGHSVMRYASRSDVLRGWKTLAGDAPMPRANKVSPPIWRRFVRQAAGDNRYFGTTEAAGWDVTFFRQWKYPHRYAGSSGMTFCEADWKAQWPKLLARMEAGELEPIKRSRSGDVWMAQLELAGTKIDVVVKRPYRKKWFRYINEIGRGSRVTRAWKKSWALITRNLPAAWPLAMIEKRKWGYVTDQVLICQRVNGPTLATCDLNQLDHDSRWKLFWRAGHILRRIEELGYCHFDPKASNWIVQDDAIRGAEPIMVDVDGLRGYRWDTFGIKRLLRSMRDHAQYQPEDSLALCKGYAPYGRFVEPEELA